MQVEFFGVVYGKIPSRMREGIIHFVCVLGLETSETTLDVLIAHQRIRTGISTSKRIGPQAMGYLR